MKFFVTGFLFWTILTLPGSARSTEGMGYLLTLTPAWKESVEGIGYSKSCGDYFVANKSAKKIVHFIYEERFPKRLPPISAYVTMNFVDVSIDKEMTTPPMIITKRDGSVTYFFIRTNVEDYIAGLPCFGNGAEI